MNGLYLLRAKDGSIQVDGRGPLSSQSTAGNTTIYFEGLLLSDRRPGHSDCDVALAAYQGGGPDAVAALDGFFNALIVENGKVELLSDMFVTRPLLIYHADGATAIAPTPLFFAEHNLPMTLDRQGCFEFFRFYHGMQGRTLIAEITRPRPRTRYTIHQNGALSSAGPAPCHKHEDTTLSLDDAADMMREQQRNVLQNLTSHPALAGRQRHLPLTAGMDSRQILAELIELGTPPDRTVHIWHQDAEALPVREMTDALGLPLTCPRVEALPWPALTEHWLQSTGGLLHFHQAFLFAVAQDDQPAVGFDGYLADYFTGYAPRPLSKRNYNPIALRLMFPDHADLLAELDDSIAHELSLWHGPREWRELALDPMNRGPGYTGWVFGALPGDNLYFAPGAHPSALDLFCRVPQKFLHDKAARLHMFRRDFPDLAQYPTEQGRPISAANTLPVSAKMNGQKWAQLAKGFLPFSGVDPAPQSEHAWLRQIHFLRSAAETVFSDGEILKDPSFGRLTRLLWPGHRAGGYSAWTIMGIISLEVAHQVLILRREPRAVANWLVHGS